MKAYCDHCGKETSHTQYDKQITWCAGCIKGNAELLGGLNLVSFLRPRIDEVIAANSSQSFGFAENISKLQSIPKKKHRVNSLPLGTRVKLADNRLGSGQEGILVAKSAGSEIIILGWNSATDPDFSNAGGSYTTDYLERIENHDCDRFLSIAYDREVEVLPSRVEVKPIMMKLQDAKLGDTVRIVGTSYDGCIATIIADNEDGYGNRALAIKSANKPPKENYFVKLNHEEIIKNNHPRISDQEIEQFDRYLWFPGNHYQVEVISRKAQNKIENKGTVEVLESEDKMAVNVNTLQAGQEIDHPKYGRMIVLGTYSGSGERLLGKKEKFEGATDVHPKNNSGSYFYWDKFDGKDYWVKWFPASEQVNMVGERALKFGVKVGDKVEIFRKKSYDGLMDTGYEPDLQAPKFVGTVVGFNTNGEPNVYLDEPGTQKDRLNGYNSTLIDKTFLDNKSFMDKVSKNPNNFWLIRTDKAFNKLKERHMETKQERPAFLEMMKGDATNAAYRVASMQMTKGIKSGILAVLEKQGTDGTKLKAISEMLDTEFGTSLVSLLLGVGLQYIPKISEDPRAQKLASEFRVGGIAVAGNMVVDVALEHFLPVITGALNALPPQEPAVRVAETPKVETNNQLSLEQAIREEAEKADEKTDQVMKA